MSQHPTPDDKLPPAPTEAGYHKGFLDAVRAFAWWRNGAQYVGAGLPLADVLADIESSPFFAPGEAPEYLAAYFHAGAWRLARLAPFPSAAEAFDHVWTNYPGIPAHHVRAYPWQLDEPTP